MTDSKVDEMREKYPELFKGMPDPVEAPASDIISAPEGYTYPAPHIDASMPIAAPGANPVNDPGANITPLGSVGSATVDAPAAIPSGSGPGFVVFWSVNGGASRTSVEASLASVGAGIRENFPGAPSPIAALQRARTSTAGKLSGVVLRSIAKGSVAVVSERDGAKAGQLDYSHGVTVSVPTGTATALTVDGYDDTAQDCLIAANELARSYSEHRDRVEAADLSAWLTACTADLGAVSLRPRGGVYFIPATAGAKLALIKAAAKATGAATLYTMALDGDESTAQSVAGATAESFLGDFRSIEREVGEWTAGLVDAKRPGRGFNALSSQLKTLKDRVFMYREVLAAQESSLTSVIAGAESALKATFNKYTSAKASPAQNVTEAVSGASSEK